MNKSNLNLSTKSLDQLITDLMEKKYTSKDLVDISYRTINYWTEQRFTIFEKNLEDRQWRKFSFAELIWIKMLDEFRKLGVSVEKVAFPIRRYFGEHDFHPNEPNPGNEIYGSSVVHTITEWETHLHFAWLLAITIHYQNPVSIRVFMDGTVREIFADPYFSGIKVLEVPQKDYQSNFQPFISISIDKILMEVIPDLDFKTIDPFGIVNDNERELLIHLSKKEVSNIAITNTDGNTVDLDFAGQKGNFESSLLFEAIRNGSYQTISYRTISGKTAIFEQTTQIINNAKKEY